MASASSSRRSERRKAVGSHDDVEVAESRIVQSKHRTSKTSTRSHKAPRPIIFNEFHATVSINGNGAFGSGHEDQLPHQPSSGLTKPNSRKAPLKSRNREELLALLDESSSSDASPISSRDSSPAPTSSRKAQHHPSPLSTRSDRTWPDEGYGTDASIRGSSTRRGKADKSKVYHNRKLGRVSSSISSGKSRSNRRNSPRYDSEQEEDISVDETHLAKEERDEEDDDDSDDDFANRTIKLEGPNNEELEIRAILDTGTKADWISSLFLEKLKKKHSKIREDQNKEYRDFQGKFFKAIGTIDLRIICDDFQGFKCKQKTFLVAKESTFDILLGRRTIKEECLLRTRPPDTSGEGAFPGIQSGISKTEQVTIAQSKAKQEKEAAEQAKKRQASRVAGKAKDRQNPKPAQLAHFASESKNLRRKSRSRSPSRKATSRTSGAKTRAPPKEKISSSSLEGCW